MIVGSDRTFYRFDSAGNQRWAVQVEGNVTGGSALTGDAATAQDVIVAWAHYPAPYDVRMSRINLETGAVELTAQIEVYGLQTAAPLVFGDKVFFNTHVGSLKMFNVATGEVVWSSGVYDGLGAGVTPMYYNGRLTVVGRSGNMRQFHVDDGSFSVDPSDPGI